MNKFCAWVGGALGGLTSSVKRVTDHRQRRYRFDWQYAVDRSRLPLVSQASATIAAMPALVNAGLFGSLFRSPVSPAIWLAWLSAVLFLISYAIVKLRCPRFVQEYRDFGEYLGREHSHRWIVWEIYNNIERLKGWQKLIKECRDKNVAADIDDLNSEERSEVQKSFAGESASDVTLYKPVNVNRDLFLPVASNSEKLAIFLREKDTELEEKEKEIFWILYSQAVKERPLSRFIFWVFWHSFVIAGGAAILFNAWSVVSS